MRVVRRWMVMLAGAATCAGPVMAQDASRPGEASGMFAERTPAEAPRRQTGTAQPSSAYTFPSDARLTKFWAMNTFGPVGVLRSAASAALQFGANTPREWGQDWEGYGQRFGTALATNAINQSTLSLVSAVTQQDPIYYRCPCTGFGPRLGHVIKMTFMARNRAGQMVFSPAKVIAPFSGNLVTRSTLYPDNYGPADGARSGVYSLGGNVGWNFLREFILKAPRW